tara:strand:- start:2395 stop:3267 length:873 start_codon:yes stop_codon:yes gene_type:complete
MDLFGEKKKWSIIQIINFAKNNFVFIESNKNPQTDIEIFLCFILKCNRADLYLKNKNILNNAQLDILRSYIDRRNKNEPIQYIIKNSNFYGRDFFVNSDVLIPRPETERLIDIALEKAKKIEFPKIFDVGTGSGCISITLALEIPDSQVYGSDISKKAIKIAQKNKDNLFVENLQLINEDIFLKISHNSLDILISNPPYVKPDEYLVLMPDVLNFEPKIGLTDDLDGLSFYKRLAELGMSHLNKGGWIIVEVGKGKHPQEAKEIFKKYDYKNIKLFKDYNQDQRVLVAQN